MLSSLEVDHKVESSLTLATSHCIRCSSFAFSERFQNKLTPLSCKSQGVQPFSSLRYDAAFKSNSCSVLFYLYNHLIQQIFALKYFILGTESPYTYIWKREQVYYVIYWCFIVLIALSTQTNVKWTENINYVHICFAAIALRIDTDLNFILC